MAKRDNFTRRLLIDGGISGNMRVLDVGCGFGDVTFLVKDLIDENGEVVGVDIDEAALNKAQILMKEKEILNVKFIKANIEDIGQDIGMFDAIVGRRVLMYQRDVHYVIKGLKKLLKENGKMIFQESDSIMTSVNLKSMPLHEKAQKWILDTVAKEGGNVHMGMNLYTIFTQAGLTVEDIRTEGVVLAPDIYDDMAFIIRAMLPRIVQNKVAKEEEIDIETLAKRLKDEMKTANSIFVRDMMFGILALNKN